MHGLSFSVPKSMFYAAIYTYSRFAHFSTSLAILTCPLHLAPHSQRHHAHPNPTPPGLYLLLRHAPDAQDLLPLLARGVLASTSHGGASGGVKRVASAPKDLPLYCLSEGDVRQMAYMVSQMRIWRVTAYWWLKSLICFMMSVFGTLGVIVTTGPHVLCWRGTRLTASNSTQQIIAL